MSEDDKSLLQGSVNLLSLKVSDITDIISEAKNEENIQSLILAVKKSFGLCKDVLAATTATRNVKSLLQRRSGRWLPSCCKEEEHDCCYW